MEMSIVSSEADKEKASLNQICYGCNLPIIDRFLLKVLDKLWHDRCLRCCHCDMKLTEKCFTRDSKLYCKQDFYKLFGVQCSGCEQGVFPSDLIRRVGEKVFHISCLKCHQCGQEVATGDQLYILENSTFLCKSDYEKAHKNEAVKMKEKHSLDNDSYGEACDKVVSTASTNEEHPVSDEEEETNRRRGPRTTIKAKQLEMLKSAFLATPKPSRHIREKLAHDTGLTMRVIQVWFQNRRSKERRVKQLSVQDARRGFKKTDINKETGDLTYPFFQTPSPIEEYTHQRRFSYDLYGPANHDNCAVSNNNNIPLSLPSEVDIMLENQESCATNKSETTDYIIEPFTSQLQQNAFKNHNIHKFSPPLRPTTFEGL